MLKTLAFIFIVSATDLVLGLRFKGDATDNGHFIEHKKYKHVRNEMGEDAFLTTPVSIIVADGVGSCLFPATYLARWLSWGVSLSFMRPEMYSGKTVFADSEEFRRFVLGSVREAVVDYSQVFNIALHKYELLSQAKKQLHETLYVVASQQNSAGNLVPQTAESIEKVEGETNQVSSQSTELKNQAETITVSQTATQNTSPLFFSQSQTAFIKNVYRKVSSTFASVFIDNNDLNQSLLRIYQKGDSLVVLFELVASTSDPDYLVYLPKLITKDNSPSFNVPLKFRSHSNLGSPDDGDLYEVRVKEGDLVVVASDGLFDNMYLSFLTFLVNYLASMTVSKQITNFDIEEQLRAFAEAFVNKVMNNDPEEDVDDSLKSESDSKTDQTEKHSGHSTSTLINDQSSKRKTPSKIPFLFNLVCKIFSIDIDNPTDIELGTKSPKERQILKRESTRIEERMSTYHKKLPITSYIEKNTQSVIDPFHFGKMLTHLLKCYSRDLADQGATAESSTLHPCVIGRLSKLKTLHRVAHQSGFQKHFNGKIFSEKIAKTAEVFAKNQFYWSPFADKAFQHEICLPPTGKPDDITVVSSLIINSPIDSQKTISDAAARIVKKLEENVVELRADLNVALGDIEVIKKEFDVSQAQVKKQAAEIKRRKQEAALAQQAEHDSDKIHLKNII
jgi:hypothetical protein